MHRRFSLMFALCAAAIFATAVSAWMAGPPQFDLSWHTIDSGGATFSTGGSFQLGGTIGQPDAGAPLTGGSFSLAGGFWPAAAGGTVTPCVPDITGDQLVDVNDLLAVIGGWGPCPDPNNCPADIAPPGGNDIIDVNDLLVVIGGWGACP